MILLGGEIIWVNLLNDPTKIFNAARITALMIQASHRANKYYLGQMRTRQTKCLQVSQFKIAQVKLILYITTNQYSEHIA